MGNTAEETALVKQALHLITIKYRDHVAPHPHLMTLMGKPDQIVKFMDENDFMPNLALTGLPKAGCTVNGFTDYLTKPPTIYINRTRAKPATIIHELLHYLTHDTFRKSFDMRTIEGATEYFTRKVQGRADDKLDMFRSDRSRIYADELDELKFGRTLAKKTDPAQKGVMKRAYFGGDLRCITMLREIIKG